MGVVFHGGKPVAHVIVEYVNVSPSVTGIETGSVATVVGCMLGVPNCVPASVRPSMMIAPFALPAAAPAGATAASDATSAKAMNPALGFNWSPSVAFGGVAPAPRRILYADRPALRDGAAQLVANGGSLVRRALVDAGEVGREVQPEGTPTSTAPSAGRTGTSSTCPTSATSTSALSWSAPVATRSDRSPGQVKVDWRRDLK